ncbi:unnamed protein product [Gordionus sp. m RMFG-2023]|uniref:uncharacterized protein LOC135929791 isoform X2 n=1 Tax=Gordionus sp. m RMFG-2023 TaxID=3053472 RepID=UPI0030DFA408
MNLVNKYLPYRYHEDFVIRRKFNPCPLASIFILLLLNSFVHEIHSVVPYSFKVKETQYDPSTQIYSHDGQQQQDKKRFEVFIVDSSTDPRDACWKDLSHCEREVRLEISLVIRANTDSHDLIADAITTSTHPQRGDLLASYNSGDILKGSYPYVSAIYSNDVLSLTVGQQDKKPDEGIQGYYGDTILDNDHAHVKARWTLSATAFELNRRYNVTLLFGPSRGLSLFVGDIQRGHIKIPQMRLLSSPSMFDSSLYSAYSAPGSLAAHSHHYIDPLTGITLEHTRVNSLEEGQGHLDNNGAQTAFASILDIQVIGLSGDAKLRTTRSPPVIIDSRGYPVLGRSGQIPPHPRNALRNSRNSYRISFINNGFIRYTSKDPHMLSQDFEIFIDFQARSKNGFLFYAGRDVENMYLKLEDGNAILYINTDYGKRQVRLEILYPPGYEIMPSSKHQISVKKTGNKVMMSIDNQYVQQKELPSEFTPLSHNEEIYFDFGGTNRPIGDRSITKTEHFNGTFYEITITKETSDKVKIYPVESLIRREPEVQVFGTLRYLSRQDINSPQHLDVSSYSLDDNVGESLSFNEWSKDGTTYLTLSPEAFQKLADGMEDQGTTEIRRGKVGRIVSMKVMTNEPRGILLYDDSSVPVCLEIFNHRLYVVYNDDGQTYRSEIYALPLSRLANIKYELTDSSINIEVSDQPPLRFRITSSPMIYGNIYIGGKSPTAKSSLPTLSTNSFIGCIQNLVINKASTPTFNEDHLNSGRLKIYRVDSCRSPSPRCTRTACYNSGSCREGWNRTYCDCSLTPYAGANCREVAPTLDLDGNQLMKVILPSNFTSSTTEIALRFKTKQSHNSIVLFADCTSADNLKIFLENGRLKVSYVNNGLTNTVSSRNSYIDGLWHQVDFRKDGPNVKVQIDEETFRNADIYGSSARPMTIQSIQVGGSEQVPNSYFQGSIQHLYVNGMPFLNREGTPPIPSSQVVYPSISHDTTMDKREHYKVFAFDGTYYYKKLDDYRKFHPTNNVIRIQVRTNRPSGGIMSISSPNSPVRMNLEAESGKPKLIISYEGQQYPIYSDVTLNDGNWHDIIITRENDVITLKTDNYPSQRPFQHQFPPNIVPNIYQILVGASENIGGGYNGYNTGGMDNFVGQVKNPQCDGVDLSTDWIKMAFPTQPVAHPPPQKQYFQQPQPPVYNPRPVQPYPPQYNQHIYKQYQPPPQAPPTKGYVQPRPTPPPVKSQPQTYPPYPQQKIIYRPPPPPVYYPPPRPPPPIPQTKAPPAPPPSRPCLVTFDGTTYAKVIHPQNSQSNLVGNRDLELHFKTGQQGKTAILSTSDKQPGGDRGNALLYLDEAGRLNFVTRYQDGNGRKVDKTLQTGAGLNDNRWHKVRIVQRGHGTELIVDDRERSTNYDDIPGMKPLVINESYLGADVTDAFSQENVAPLRGEIKDYTLDNNDILCDWANNRRSSYTVHYPLRIDTSRILQFNGNQFMKVIFPYPNPNYFRNEINMHFNTKNPNGVLFATLPGPGNENQAYLLGMLENGVLKVIARDGTKHKEILLGNNLNDGRWHRLKVVHDNNNLSVFLDDYPHITSQVFDRPGGTNLILNQAHFGGFETNISQYAHLPGFTGYLRDISINSRDFIRMHTQSGIRDGYSVYYPCDINRPRPITEPPIIPIVTPPTPPVIITPIIPPVIVTFSSSPSITPTSAYIVSGEPPVIIPGGFVQSSSDLLRPLKSHLVSGWGGPVLAAIAALFPLLAGILWALYKCKPGLCAGPMWGRGGGGKAIGSDYKSIPLVSHDVQVVEQQQKPVVGYLSGADAGMYSQVQRTRRKEEEEFMIREGGTGATVATGLGSSRNISSATDNRRETYLSNELDTSVKALTRALDRERSERQHLITPLNVPAPHQPGRVEKETEEYTKVVRYGRDGRGPGYWGGPAPFIAPSHEEARPASGYDYQIQSINTLNRSSRERNDPRFKESTRMYDQDARYEEFRTDGSSGSPPYFIETPRVATLNSRPEDTLLSGPPQSMMAIESLIVTPDNLNVITGSDTVPPQIWNLETGQISKILEGEEGSSDLYLASNNDRVLVGLALSEPIPSSTPIPKKKLTTWDIDSGNKTMTYGKDSFSALTLLNDKRTAVLTSFEENSPGKGNEVNVTLLDVLNGGAVDKRLSYTPTFPLNNVRAFLRKSSDDNYILAGFYESSQQASPHVKSIDDGNSGGLCNVIIVDLGEIKRGNTDSKAFSVTVTNPECVVILNPDRAATGSPKGELTLWNLSTGKKQGHLREAGNCAHLGPVTALTASPDGRYLVSASKDTSIKSWQDLGNREFVHKIAFHGHKGQVTCLDLSRDGKLLASGSTDKMIRLWNFEDGSHLCSFETSTEILNIKISRDNRTIVAIGQRDGIKKLIILKVLP